MEHQAEALAPPRKFSLVESDDTLIGSTQSIQLRHAAHISTPHARDGMIKAGQGFSSTIIHLDAQHKHDEKAFFNRRKS